MKKIGIVMGSDSDLPVVEKAMATLEKFGVPFEAHVYSAHRTPVEASEFAKGARANGFGAIIAAAGKAAHLAGAMAANTTLPVIGIPIKSSTLDGLDALLSTVQMPGGLPVATVAIDGAENAALLAIQILAVEDAILAEKLDNARKEAAEKVLAACFRKVGTALHCLPLSCPRSQPRFPLYPYYNPKGAFWPDFRRNILFTAKKAGLFQPIPEKDTGDSHKNLELRRGLW